MTADRAALAYLIASGATAISIIERDGVADLHAGTKIDPLAVAVFWPPDAHARPRLQGREKKNCRGGARCRDDARGPPCGSGRARRRPHRASRRGRARQGRGEAVSETGGPPAIEIDA